MIAAVFSQSGLATAFNVHLLVWLVVGVAISVKTHKPWWLTVLGAQIAGYVAWTQVPYLVAFGSALELAGVDVWL